MVGFLRSPTSEEAVKEETEDIFLSASKKTSLTNDPLELCVPDLEDFSASFSDSFLDFDTLNSWLLEGNLGFPDMTDLGGNDLVDLDSGGGQFEGSKGNLGVCGDGICREDEVRDEIGGKEENLKVLEEEIRVVEEVSEKGVLGGDVSAVNLGGLALGCLIEEQLGKVSLEGESNCSAPENANVGGGEAGPGGACVSDAVVGNGMKTGENGGEEESESESSSASTSSSSSSSSGSSSSSDEESGEMSGERKKNVERSDVEDGEILLSDTEEMVGWGEDEDANEDGGGSRPILSRNEVKDLPPVPPVDVTLEPHHQTLPVGTILSVIGSQVIVEGLEKHSPLDEGSILWVTESRLPLGIIDEIFGPVKNPYYIIRYNSEAELPAGIQQGTPISFVQEFANRILNDKSLYQKGYDASGDNDEELSDEMEFSDDEKEAEYKKSLKMKKRGSNTNTNESKPGNRRKEKRQLNNHNGNWNKNQDSVGTSLNQDNSPSPSGFRQGSVGHQAGVPPFPQTPQGPGFSAPNGLWNNSFPQQQQQNVNLPTGLWMQQNLPFPLYQNPLQMNAAFQQQMSSVPGLPLNFNAMGGQPNFGGPPTLAPWGMGLDQNALNSLPFGMGLQVHQASLPQNVGGEQGVQSQGSQVSHNMQQPSAAFSFNHGGGRGGGANGGSGNVGGGSGRGGGGGRRGHHRGRGRFGGGRGRHS